MSNKSNNASGASNNASGASNNASGASNNASGASNSNTATSGKPEVGVGVQGMSPFQQKKINRQKIRDKETTENLFRPYEPEFDFTLWLDEVIWEEGCISGKDSILKNPRRDKYMTGSLSDVVWDMYYGISELPLFGWNEARSPGPRTWKHSSILKFFYCFFKLTLFFPLYLFSLFGNFIFTLIRAIGLMIIRFGAGVINLGIFVANTIMSMIPMLNSRIAYLKLPKYVYEGPDRPSVRKTGIDPNFIDTIATLFGLTIPYHVFDKNMGLNYGKGEMGVFIIISIIISIVLIN